ncbi:glycosyltransferase family 4 protein [Gryllotalpicola ginsengisoli]|uniref:glycosyltransferase family 4 protein n=1 Tax=Gryllotalpicola ginsengisoli TaxID=444608 RepID=UPI003898DCF8
MHRVADASDLIVSVKPVPESTGLALRAVGSTGTPLLLDIDDPDLEAALGWRWTPRRIGKEVLKPRLLHELRTIRNAARRLPVIASNPYLAAPYGARVIPHVRHDPGAGSPHTRTAPVIAFVGTINPHKGIDVLRKAFAMLDLTDRTTLIVTDAAPPDAAQGERWIGPTSLEEGVALAGRSDIVPIPSLPLPYSAGQLPVKLIDAMMLGRAVVASRIPPLEWALGESGYLVAPGDVDELAAALNALRDPVMRDSLGQLARERALHRFTVDAQAGNFENACRSALAWGTSRR